MIFSFDLIYSQVANGLIMGLIYALMAIGVTTIFSIMKMVNFAHGEFYMIGGYITYYVSTQFAISPLAALVLAFVCVFGIGALVERTLLRPAYTGAIERPGEYAIIITFALSITLVNGALAVFGPFSKGPPQLELPGITFSLPAVPQDRFVSCLTAIVIVVAVLVFINKTLIGKALQATAQDRESAMAAGIDTNRMSQVVFGLGTGLAAAAGSILGPVFMVYPDMGFSVAMKAFVIVILGGLGSIRGSIVGAILLGLIEGLCMAFISPAYRDVYAFIVLIAVLALRPRGLFGEKVRAV
jgi:branched-chain amino acid transport system permease protein